MPRGGQETELSAHGNHTDRSKSFAFVWLSVAGGVAKCQDVEFDTSEQSGLLAAIVYPKCEPNLEGLFSTTLIFRGT